MSFVEKKLQEQTVYEGKIFTVRHAEVELPNGNRGFRDSIEHHGGAGILPLDAEGVPLCEREEFRDAPHAYHVARGSIPRV